MLTALFTLLDFALRLFVWALILAAAFSILSAFGVLDTRNRLVWTVGDFLYRVTDPVLRPLRRVMPNLGGVDITPFIVIVVIEYAVRPLLGSLYVGIRTGSWQPLFL